MTELEQKVLELFAEAAWDSGCAETEAIELSTRLCDLCLDSISVIEIIGRLEAELGINIPEERLIEARTLRDVSQALRMYSKCCSASRLPAAAQSVTYRRGGGLVSGRKRSSAD